MKLLGGTGHEVSAFGLGTMTWGRDTDEPEARSQYKAFIDAGGNFIDTADSYAKGVSEELVGQIIAENGNRDSIFIATKAVKVELPRMYNASSLHLNSAIDASLRRLGIDHVDLWQMHGWDPITPIDETLKAIEHNYRLGKFRYFGISNYSAWQTALMISECKRLNIPFVSAQHEYSLLQRGVEREVIPLLSNQNKTLLPWSPLGRGVLTGKYRFNTPVDSRAASNHFASFIQEHLTEDKSRIVDALITAAEGIGRSPSETALAWVRDQECVSTVILGARNLSQLKQLLGADNLDLPTEIISALSDVSAPHSSYPESGWNQLKPGIGS
jgi:aryl-alcohol dehydrogenase-like predicted oxidoreductase